jgi:4-hydroxy-tetrahydrodipicolinate synthase
MKNILQKGLYTALITPFHDGKVDYSSLEKILNFQVAKGVKNIVVCGTTGESATLSNEEKLEIAKFSANFTKGKANIFLGTGSNSTENAANLTKMASNAGVKGFLVVSPYYNKANQEGLVLHFTKIAQSTDLPIILYNVPSRTGVDIADETTAKLHEIQNIIGLKDATGNLARVPSIRAKIGYDFLLLSGEDATALAFNASGGDGVISVVSNIAPDISGELQELSLKYENFPKAFILQEKIFKIASVLFKDVNPIPVKFAMYKMGLCPLEYRLPLCEPSNVLKEEITNILKLC